MKKLFKSLLVFVIGLVVTFLLTAMLAPNNSGNTVVNYDAGAGFAIYLSVLFLASVLFYVFEKES